MEKVDSIIKTTQRNALLGFLKGALLVIVILGGVIGLMYLDAKKVSQERLEALDKCTVDRSKIESDFRQYLIDGNQRKKDDIKDMDSLKKVVEQILK